MANTFVNIPNVGGAGSGTGSPSDSPATSDTGNFSLVSLVKRYLSRVGSTKIFLGTTFAASGDNTIIAAPAAGVRIVVSALRIQNNTDLSTVVLIKSGAATTLSRCRTTVEGTGIDCAYEFGTELRLAAAQAFVLNLSAANQHGVSVIYWLETVATGLPA